MKSNKKAEFEKMFYTLYPKVKCFLIKILKSESEAEDIIQDVFTKLWKHPELWCDERSIDSYIYSMARNKAFNIIRHKKVKKQYSEYRKLKCRNTTSKFESSAEKKMYAKEIALIVRMQLEQMPEKRRNIFKMSREEGLTNQEIAKKTGLSIRTVEHHIYLALKDLREILLIAILILIN